MTGWRRTLDVVVVAIFLAVAFPRDVHAYLDPGTGSLIIQTVVAAVAALAYGFRSSIGKVFAIFSRGQQSGRGSDTDQRP